MMTIDERFNLRDRVAVVVGSAGHLCSALTEAMIELGMKVMILDVAEELKVNRAGHVQAR